jgi:hypothetical protein
MYRFKAAEGIGPVNGYFEELRSGGPFQELVLGLQNELATIKF